MAHVERRQRVADVAARQEIHRILAQAEVQVEVAVYAELADGFARQAYFAVDAVVQQVTFTLGQFAACVYFMFCVDLAGQGCLCGLSVTVGTGCSLAVAQVHQRVAAHFVRSVGCQACLSILVEAFEQRNA